MDPIAMYSSQDWLQQIGLKGVSVAGTTEKASEQASTASDSGDTVTISPEALGLLAAKMTEYDASTMNDLSTEEKDDIITALSTAEGLSDKEEQALATAVQGAGKDASADEDGTGAAKAGKQGAGGQSGGSASSSEDSDEIEDLEEDIEDLEKEIEELTAKSATDEESKESLKAKRMELSLLEAELALLEQQEEQG